MSNTACIEVYRFDADGQKFEISDPVATGRQLLEEIGKRPTEDFLIFQLLKNGMLEEIRLDETVDLRNSGIEKFLTFKNDRSFRLEIDGRRFEWGANLITGLTLKTLAQVDPQKYSVWLEVRGEGDDILVEDGGTIDLAEEGLEKFFTGVSQTTEGA